MIDTMEHFFEQWALESETLIAPWLTATIIIVITALIYLLVAWIFRRVHDRSEGNTILIAWRKFKNPILALLILFDLILLKEMFNLDAAAVAGVNHFFRIAFIFCTTWILIRGISLAREMVLKQYDLDEKDNLKARTVYTQFRVLERIIVFILIMVAIAIALMTFDGIKRIGVSIFASAGIAGIILGFAAQKLIGSVLAGFQIAITQPIRIEDVVIVENEWGWIEEINLTYVVVRIWDKRRLIVPSTYFIEKPFQNWTRSSSDILGTVFIYTDYQVPVDKLREEFQNILKGTELWDGKVSVVQVTNATDRAMEIRALMSAVDSPKAWDLRVLVREKLIDYLQKNFPESLPRTRVEVNPDGIDPNETKISN